jgi:hypothetical protein
MGNSKVISLTNKKIIYEKDRNNGLIKSKIIIYKSENDSKGLKNLPIWALVLYLMFITCLIVILIAAIVFLLYGRRPGLHGEDCIKRSCETKLGLKCIDSTCLCESNKYYLKGCNEKKSIGTYCQNYRKQCKDGFLCFNGKCSCGKNLTWDGLKCTKKGTYGDDCSKIECDDSLMLTCDSIFKTCDCSSVDRFWNEISCVLKKGLNDTPPKNRICQSEKDLTCINGLCKFSSID